MEACQRGDSIVLDVLAGSGGSRISAIPAASMSGQMPQRIQVAKPCRMSGESAVAPPMTALRSPSSRCVSIGFTAKRKSTTMRFSRSTSSLMTSRFSETLAEETVCRPSMALLVAVTIPFSLLVALVLMYLTFVSQK